MKILFSDEKLFYIDGIYNSQNNRICAEADIKVGIRQMRKFPQKIMVWLGACSEELSPLMISENGTVDHNRYINEVLPVALKYRNSIFGNDWTLEQDGAKLHFHEKTQKWCVNNFPSCIEQGDHWPPNYPDLDPLDYCLWDELGKTIKWNRVTSKKSLIVAI